MTTALPITQTLQPPQNRFIPIAPGHRAVLITYVLVYKVATPALSLVMHGSDVPLAGARLIADMVHQLLIFFPLFFYRSSYGWLHPLLFPALFEVATRLVRAPETLLMPIAVLDSPILMEIQHVALRGWSQEALGWAYLKADILLSLSLLVYYAGYFLFPRLPVPRISFAEPRNVPVKAAVIVSVATLAFLGYMQLQGGLASHMQSWRYGRSVAMAGDGPIHVLINIGTLGTLMWYALSQTATRNPAFWAAAAFSVPVNFFVSGSRSAVIYTCALFLMIWMIRHQKVPKGRVLVLGLLAFLAFGVLGALRTSVYGGEVDWAVLTEFDAGAVVERAKTESEDRATNAGFLPVIARTPQEIPLLKGESYLSVIFFWVPRALWPEKPQGAAYLNGLINYGSQNGTAVPTGPVAEAYWNFHLPGVLLLFTIYGMFHAWMARTFARYGHLPAAGVLYLLSLVYFVPYDVMIIIYLQSLIPAVAILFWMKALSFRSKRQALVAEPAFAAQG